MEIIDEYLEKKFEEIDSGSFKDLVYDVDDLKELLKDFAYEMCELQKQECANEQEGLVEQEYCLKCKNVCDE